jgi:hypothetical protein
MLVVGWLGGRVASALSSSEVVVLVSFVYVVAWRLFALVLLLARSDRSKELELLVLRHELSILWWQARPPAADGGGPADTGGTELLPRRSWQAFLVTPETLQRRCQRCSVAGLTDKPAQALRGSVWASAARSARSTGRTGARRGRRRGIASSCRNKRSRVPSNAPICTRRVRKFGRADLQGDPGRRKTGRRPAAEVSGGR